MIVQCPKCDAKYNLPDGKIGPDGAKLRCGKCKHVFLAGKKAVAPPPPPPPPAPESEAPGLEDDLFSGIEDDLFGDEDASPAPAAPKAAPKAAPEEEGDFEPPSDFDYPDFDDADGASDPLTDYGPAPKAEKAAPKAAPKPEPEDQGGDDLFSEDIPADDEPVKPGFSLDDVADIDIGGGKKSPMSKDKKKRLMILGAVFLVLILATGGALYFLDLLPGMGKPATETSETAETAPAEEAAPAETAPAEEAAKETPAQPEKEAPVSPEESAKVKNIVLQNVRQYFVTNEKAGQLCVIEGKAVNKFKTPKEMIQLKANLFDDKGAVLTSKTIMCGNTVSLFQLQVMTKQELETALSSQVGVLTNNTNIQPDGETPFMFVFFDVPETLAEFVVKVIDAKDPPAQ